MTGGRGDYHMHFLRYEEVPSHIAQKIIEETKREKEKVGAKGLTPAVGCPQPFALHALRLGLTAGLFARAEARDQVRDVCELLLEVTLVALESFEDVLAVVPASAEAAVMSFASVVHGHLPSRRSRNVSMRSRERRSAAAHSSSSRRPAAVRS